MTFRSLFSSSRFFSSAAKIVAATLVITGLSACSGAEEYRGEIEDCTVSNQEIDAVLLIDRSPTGEITGGWFAFSALPDVLVGAELDDIDVDGNALKFEAEFEFEGGKIEVEADVELEDDEFVGEIDVRVPASDSNDSCDLKLEKETR